MANKVLRIPSCVIYVPNAPGAFCICETIEGETSSVNARR